VKRAMTLSVVAMVAVAVAAARGEAPDALSRAKARGTLTACADPYNYPYSSSNSEPPGFDVEIARALAERAGMRATYFWADTGTRGGLGRALSTSILKGKCDFFMGIGEGPDTDEEMKDKHLTLTQPYLGLGYILVVQGRADTATSLADLKDKKIKVGTPMSTPVDAYLFDNGYERALYLRSREIMKALAQGEIDAAMVWSPALAIARADHLDGKFHPVAGYTPEPALRWNLAIAVPGKEAALKQFLDDSVAALLRDGEIQKIVERYGFPFYPPFR
jgi:polar amino acid transport system substrate-binding protein